MHPPFRLPLALRLKRAGIVHPVWTVRYAHMHGVPLDIGCAVLMVESGGGANVFGHDNAIAIGWGTVTKAKYLAYRALRDKTGECQGVGPMQLTSKSLQAQADVLGGCGQPKWNIAVGMHALGEHLNEHPGNLAAGVASYNGSGVLADRYATHVLAIADHFATITG